MSKFTDSEREALILIYEESKKWGEELRNKVKAGEIDPSKLVKLDLPIGTELDPSKFSQTTQFFMAMGSENTRNISVPQTSLKAINKREILRKHFPDWEERMNYQKKQEKIYRSGLARMTQAKRVRMEKTFKLTKKEQDAFDYFNGKNFYKEHQSIETPPNIYDTRRSFLLKIEKNKDMRENFLKSYNRRKIEN